MSHSNISIFVPHIGCPNACAFCNQKHITGTAGRVSANDISVAVETALLSKNYDPKNGEIAFFGGSFTAIERDYMLALLKTASTFVRQGKASGIRISTRPDAIDDEVLQILKEHCVTSIELGAQSLDDNVLSANGRGHTAADVCRASNLIKKHGFSLGLQMMTGLYKDSDEGALATAEKIISLCPETVRIYPTIVLIDTLLADLCQNGEYAPQTLSDAVSLCAKLYLKFISNGIKVIRLGLHSIEPDSYVAGPWHPAFSELCQSEIYFSNILSRLKETEQGSYSVFVAPNAISKAVGQKHSNRIRLLNAGYNCKFLTYNTLTGFEFRTERSKHL